MTASSALETWMFHRGLLSLLLSFAPKESRFKFKCNEQTQSASSFFPLIR